MLFFPSSYCAVSFVRLSSAGHCSPPPPPATPPTLRGFLCCCLLCTSVADLTNICCLFAIICALIQYIMYCFGPYFFKQKMSDWVKRIKSLFKCPPPPFFSFSSWLRCEHLSRSLAVFSLLSSEASHLQWKGLRRVEKRSPRFNLISVNLFISLATFNNGQQLIGL